MNRRNFLSTLIGGLAATAAVRSFPFRVFSFPKEIKSPSVPPKELLELWKQRLKLVSMLGPSAPADWYMHPLQLQRLKELGYVDYAISGDIREVHPDQGLLPLGSSPSITVTGISVRESRYMDPRTPPVLLPRLPRTRGLSVLSLVPHVPDRLPGPRLNPFSQVFPNPPNVNC